MDSNHPNAKQIALLFSGFILFSWKVFKISSPVQERLSEIAAYFQWLSYIFSGYILHVECGKYLFQSPDEAAMWEML